MGQAVYIGVRWEGECQVWELAPDRKPRRLRVERGHPQELPDGIDWSREGTGMCSLAYALAKRVMGDGRIAARVYSYLAEYLREVCDGDGWRLTAAAIRKQIDTIRAAISGGSGVTAATRALDGGLGRGST